MSMENKVTNKLASLTKNTVWKFTKQSAVFDEAFKATVLFSEIPNVENANIEMYFQQHYQQYGLSTDRHRILIIAQMFGLITRQRFYLRGGQYNSEKVTPAFLNMKKYEIGSSEYNVLKSEQILKVKIKSIIDSTSSINNWEIYPMIYSYGVLKELKNRGIQGITLGQFLTYVMTCKNKDEMLDTIEMLMTNPAVSEHANYYKDSSRITRMFGANSSLFIIDGDYIKINENLDEYFYENFYSRQNIEELDDVMKSIESYKEFLYNCQEFNVDIVSSDKVKRKKRRKYKPKEDGEKYDAEYVMEVDQTETESETPNNNHLNPPTTRQRTSTIPERKPYIGKRAIKNANYICQNDSKHLTFLSKTTNKPFMEPHHLIPMEFANEIWEQQNINIDCEENIVCLCPICHSAIHYGTDDVKKALIEKMYDLKIEDYSRIRLNISLDDLIDMYIK